jgi:hypothetical protein
MRSTTERGYGGRHKAERKKWQATINLSPVPCVRCQQPITVDDKWELDHTDDRTGYLGPACARCNRAAGGRKGRAAQLAPTTATIRDW